ncbi:MAG: globin [Pseudomonadota bacterium]
MVRLHSETSAQILESWAHYEPRIHDVTVRAFQILFLRHPETRDDIAAIDRLPFLVSDGLSTLIKGFADEDEQLNLVVNTLAETLVHVEADTEDLMGRYITSYRSAFIDALREDAPPDGFTGVLEHAWQSLFEHIESEVSQAKQAVVVSHRRSQKAQRLGFLVS